MRRMAIACLVLLASTLTMGAAPFRIVTSFYPIYITILNVAKNVPGVQVVNLTPPFAGCLHDYQLAPRDMKILAGADVFVINGAGMESFHDEAVRLSPEMKMIGSPGRLRLNSLKKVQAIAVGKAHVQHRGVGGDWL